MARKHTRFAMLSGVIATSITPEGLLRARLRSSLNNSLTIRKRGQSISLPTVKFGSTLGEMDDDAVATPVKTGSARTKK